MLNFLRDCWKIKKGDKVFSCVIFLSRFIKLARDSRMHVKITCSAKMYVRITCNFGHVNLINWVKRTYEKTLSKEGCSV